MTGWVNLERSSPISRHLSICSEAKDSTYVRDVDLKSWAELPGKNGCNFLRFVPFGYNENEMTRSGRKIWNLFDPRMPLTYSYIHKIKKDFASRIKNKIRNLKAHRSSKRKKPNTISVHVNWVLLPLWFNCCLAFFSSVLLFVVRLDIFCVSLTWLILWVEDGSKFERLWGMLQRIQARFLFWLSISLILDLNWIYCYNL